MKLSTLTTTKPLEANDKSNCIRFKNIWTYQTIYWKKQISTQTVQQIRTNEHKAAKVCATMIILLTLIF